MTRLHVSIGLNIALALLSLGLGLKAMGPLPPAGITAGTVNPMIRINQALTLYHHYQKSRSSSELVTASDDLSAAGGEMMTFGNLNLQPNIAQLGIVVSELGLDLADPKSSAAVFARIQEISRYLPSNTTALKRYQSNTATFNKGASDALKHLPANSTLYFK